MKRFLKNNLDTNEALSELMQGSGVIVVENIFDLKAIKNARIMGLLPFVK